MLAWIAWIVSTVFILLLTYVAFRFTRCERPSVNLVGFLFLWIFFTTAYMLFIGLAGLLKPSSLLILSALGLIPFLIFSKGRLVVSEMLKDAQTFWYQVVAWWRGFPRWLQLVTIFFGVVGIIRFTFLILALPPFVWDSLTYHLTNVAEWTQSGEIKLFETSMVRIYTPANYEVLALWFTVFLHHDVIVEAAGIPAFFLAILSVYAISRQLNGSREASWIGALTYSTLPALLLAATGTKNDPHMAAYFLAALTMVLGLVQNRDPISDKNLPGQFVLILMILLYAFGTKAYMLHISLGLIYVITLGNIRGRGWHNIAVLWKSLLKHLRRMDSMGRSILLVLVLLGSFMGLYWNIRNWVLTGNPFYPYGVEVEKAQVLAGTGSDHELSLERFLGNIESMADKFGDKKSVIGPDLDNSTGWGWFVYSLGIPAVVLAFFRVREIRHLTLGFLVSFVAILFSIRPSPWNMRYLLWLPAIFSIAFAWLLDEMRSVDRHLPRLGVHVLAILAMSLNLIAMLNYGRIRLERFEAILAKPLFERDAASLRINLPWVYENSLEIVPVNELLGYNVHSNGFIYPLYRANLSQHLVYIPIDLTGTCYDIAETMKLMGTRYLFVAPEHTSDSIIAHLNVCGEAEIALRERTGNLYVLKE